MRVPLLLAFCAVGAAQTVSVYSEFARIDATGTVTAPEAPREILSPMLVRNGFTSFQIVVRAAAGKRWELHVGQNPDNAVRITLYRESGDILQAAPLPVAAEGTAIFWMDLWIAKDAPVGRIKVEPELNIDDDWVIYPIEGRVVDAAVPEGASASGSMRVLLCAEGGAESAPVGVSATALHFRNAGQDVALASRRPLDELKKVYGACDAAPSPDPEWYLRIRDYLFRLR